MYIQTGLRLGLDAIRLVHELLLFGNFLAPFPQIIHVLPLFREHFIVLGLDASESKNAFLEREEKKGQKSQT